MGTDRHHGWKDVYYVIETVVPIEKIKLQKHLRLFIYLYVGSCVSLSSVVRRCVLALATGAGREPRLWIKVKTMVIAKDVAQFFIAKGLEQEEDGISNLKLQKLLYYAKGFHLAIFKENLFPEKLRAWTHGPVVPAMYHSYKKYGKGPIISHEYDSSSKFTEDQLDLLDLLDDWMKYGMYLVNSVHGS